MDAIDNFANHRTMLGDHLASFIANIPEGLNETVLIALANKIEHMCINIGSPSSVKPMFNSIVNRKIKKWVESDFNAGKKDDFTGRQLNGYPQWYLDAYYQKTDGTHNIMTGHFRWDHGTYMVERDEANYIYFFLIEGTFPVKRKASADIRNKFYK